MLRSLLFKETLLNIEKSLDVYSLRQKTLANNVANATTPNYQAQKVDFETEFKKSIEQGHVTKRMVTNDNHIIMSKAHDTDNVDVSLRDNTSNDTGMNNVDIDKEMAEMAENNLRYEMSMKLAARKYNGLKKAIKGFSQG